MSAVLILVFAVLFKDSAPPAKAEATAPAAS
jgi:hypothetical protein